MFTTLSFITWTLLAGTPPALAQQTSFSDLPAGHPAHQAVMYLKEQGYVQGFPDGTFKPNQPVNRAEAVKMIVAPLVAPDQLPLDTSVFADVPRDAWFARYIEAARTTLAMIDSPPQAFSFYPTRTVNKAEFLKLSQLANKEQPLTSYGELRLPLAPDVQNPGEWFYPYVRLGIALSMVQIGQDGLMDPGRPLTRGDTANLIYRLLMYKQGRRTQALLSEAESDIINVLQMIEARNVEQASYASARAMLAARGALTSRPDEPLIKGAVKISEGFQSIVLAYKAGMTGNLDETVRRTKEAWDLADQAKAFSPSLETLASQLQTIAKNMADEARTLQSQAQ